MNRQTFLFWTGAALSVALILCYIFFGGLSAKPHSDLNTDVQHVNTNDQIERAASLFESELNNFDRKNRALLDIFRQNNIQEASGGAVYNLLPDSDFWGVTVLRNGEKWIWKDFDISTIPDIQNRPSGISVTSLNNTTLLLNIETVILGENIYTIFSSALLDQPSDLPITPAKDS